MRPKSTDASQVSHRRSNPRKTRCEAHDALDSCSNNGILPISSMREPLQPCSTTQSRRLEMNRLLGEAVVAVPMFFPDTDTAETKPRHPSRTSGFGYRPGRALRTQNEGRRPTNRADPRGAACARCRVMHRPSLETSATTQRVQWPDDVLADQVHLMPGEQGQRRDRRRVQRVVYSGLPPDKQCDGKETTKCRIDP